jgi:kynurenine 3-monooxygenase
MTGSKDKHITLIGAGLVGSLLAVFLAKRGYQVDIYERRPDLRCSDISAGRSINLALANRGIKPLEAVGLMDEVEKLLLPMRGRMVHDLEGNSNFQAYGQKPHEQIYSVSRGDLNKLMMTAAEQTGLVKIHFNHQLQHVDFDNNQLTLLDEKQQSQQVPFKRVIGTDGSGSVVRQAIMAKVGDYDKEEALGHSYKELSIAPGPKNSFKIAKDALHIWPRGGFMLIALPNLDGSFTLTLFMPNEGETSFSSIDNAAKLDAFFDQHFAHVKPLIHNLHGDFFNNPTGRLATVRCSPWHFEDKALLLGDAAHAIVPFHGQGMNCGFEDALAFAEVLDSGINDWKQIFARTEQARLANANAIADMAIENYREMRDSVLHSDYLLKKQIAFQLEQWFGERFTPRYAMVMFHHLPYAEAQRLGEIHKVLLTKLAGQIEHIDQLDKDKSDALLTEMGL